MASAVSDRRKNATPALASDGSSALHAAKKRGPGRMKYVEVRFLALRQRREQQQRREQKRLEFEKIGTDDNERDMLTKPLTKEKLKKISRDA